ncbi:MAG: helix-turn-helix domain-containing protein [Lachnospiraceae bacterium]|nr:helix-turn-helix domain-containing protein [Lachnospiraceae bacterium]
MPVIDMTATGLKIQELKDKAGMTVKDLQGVFGFTSPYPVYKWQNGQNLPTLDNLVILAKLFGVKMDDIVVTK